MKGNKLLLIITCSIVLTFQLDYKSYINNLGLNLEEETIVTKDRYVNTVWVITSKDETKNNNKSIILQHGLLDGGWTWVSLGKKSLGYLLAEEGYKVYIYNIRGTQFSTSHLDYDQGLLSEYWDFSFDQMAEYDLPALIDYIKKKDGVDKVDYIGHSQGTLIFFLAYMNDPNYMEKSINKYIALGTVPNVNNAPHFLIKLFKEAKILDFIPLKNFLTLPTEIGEVAIPFCTGALKGLCEEVIKLAVGDSGRIDYGKLFKTLFRYEPGGTSLQNMKHWIQVYSAKKMQKYDYGSALENLKHYGRLSPPEYPLSNMNGYSIPSIITISNNDLFANPDDILEFVSNIKKPNVVNVKSMGDYSHVDYIWSEDTYDAFYPELLAFLKN